MILVDFLTRTARLTSDRLPDKRSRCAKLLATLGIRAQCQYFVVHSSHAPCPSEYTEKCTCFKRTREKLINEITSGSLTETRHYYHAPSQNQVLEERVGSSTSAERQYTWNPGYIDNLLLRKRDTNADGTLDETLYPLTDITYDVVALADASGTIVERFLYDPYGKSTVLDANFAVDSDGISDYDWEYRFTSREFDKETGLDYFRARHYSSGQGRFVNRDPLEYPDGMNAYAGYFAPQIVDPSGLVPPVEVGPLSGPGNPFWPSFTPKTRSQICQEKMDAWKRVIQTMTNDGTKISQYNCPAECCSQISFYIMLPHTCLKAKGKSTLNEVGHTGIGVDGDFYDYGPSPSDPSLGDVYWDNDFSNGNSSEQDIITNIGTTAVDKGVLRTAIRVRVCVPKAQGQQVRDYWESLYNSIRSGDTEYCVPGKHCTSTAIDSFNGGKDFYTAPGSAFTSPTAIFFHLSNGLKHSCGGREGDKAEIQVLQYETNPF